MSKRNGFVRTHFFIDRRFQGRYMLTFLVPMVVMLVFMLFTLYFATQTMIGSTTRIIQSDIQRIVSQTFQDEMNPTNAMYQNCINEITGYLQDFFDTNGSPRAFMPSLLWVFGAGIFIVIIQVVLLTIFFSHKVAGPIYRLEKMCHAVIEGDYAAEIHLRKGDEMKNLVSLFNEMISMTRGRLASLRDCSDEEAKKKICAQIKI